MLENILYVFLSCVPVLVLAALIAFAQCSHCKKVFQKRKMTSQRRLYDEYNKWSCNSCNSEDSKVKREIARQLKNEQDERLQTEFQERFDYKVKEGLDKARNKSGYRDE